MSEPIVVLLVEDDEAHAEIVRRNLLANRLTNPLIHVSDGEAALDYLYRRNRFSNPTTSPRPGLVVLDLRLPKVDGLEVLRIIKADPKLLAIPVVILTTSNSEEDKQKAYAAHANSYLVKPVHFPQFKKLMESFGYYWLASNAPPHEQE